MKVLLKFKKAGSVFLAIVLLALSMSMSVLASSTIDMSRLGSITINKFSAGTSTDISLSGIQFTVYKVADLSHSGDYSLTNDFSGSGVQLDKLSTASAVSNASKTLASYVSANNISGSSNVTNLSGTVNFKNLALGYYLVVQNNTSSNQNIYSACDPFLVPVPMKNSDGSNWAYDIVANPKSENVCGAVILEKVNSSRTLLSGAVFRLEKKVYYLDSSIPSGMQTGSDNNGNYYWNTLVSELATNNYGQIVVKSMPYGQYRFIETVAPTGYTLDSTPHEFSISTFGSVTLVDGKYVTASGTVQTITAVNSYEPSDHDDPPDHDDPSDPKDPTNPEEPTNPETPGEQEIIDEKVPLSVVDLSNAETPVDLVEVQEEKVPLTGFNLPKTGGSICYAVCTYGGIVLIICGVAVFVASRKKKV